MAQDPFQAPKWLRDHPELQRRGIVLTDCLKPSFVYRTTWQEERSYAVKILQRDDEEADICKRLRESSDPRNHTIPCEVIESEQKPILLMPCLELVEYSNITTWSTSRLLATLHQVVEGVEYLHEQKIAHMDICGGNILEASEAAARLDARLLAGRVYIIDFHTSRQLSLGPGEQGAIVLPPAQFPPPEGIDRLDPYSWDVYCVGKLVEYFSKSVYYHRPTEVPWVVSSIQTWLIGNEKGCFGVCRCRPTARRARRMLSILRWFLCSYDAFISVVNRSRTFFVSSP